MNPKPASVTCIRSRQCYSKAATAGQEATHTLKVLLFRVGLYLINERDEIKYIIQKLFNSILSTCESKGFFLCLKRGLLLVLIEVFVLFSVRFLFIFENCLGFSFHLLYP